MRQLLLLGSLLFVAGFSWAQPANDDPCSATALTTSATCTYATYTNAAATATGGVTAPGCASYSGGDVCRSEFIDLGIFPYSKRIFCIGTQILKKRCMDKTIS